MKFQYAFILCILFLLIVGCTQTVPAPINNNGNLAVHFIDVGQGDSELVRFPNGETMLVDAGTTDSEVSELAYLKKIGVTHLDAVVATHPHVDHIGGMEYIITNVPTSEYIDGGSTSTEKTYTSLMTKIPNHVIVRHGDSIVLDPNVSVKVLSSKGYVDSEDLNEQSVVLQITYGRNTFLLMGDAGYPIETKLVTSGDELGADVLKVGHHGSSTASSVQFLNAIVPRYAVIEVGANNKYGHPTKQTLARLEKVKVYRTDLGGTIVISSNGDNISVI
ncbi:MAG: ComEC/Rec2 family competence protein [Candidatus Paceibacterota bacterium]|jgi:beta-lactamase superfamily II metal-dependent hydrolase